jgi:exopolyphosphatase/guanosine-5'-triphosphate,3'-diphosphate pyrophosphatase
VNVAVIDVGSNSVRLLVASVADSCVEELHRERVYMRLGDDAYRLGRISAAKLDETRAVARRFARVAREHGAERLETIVTAPGRQSSNHEHLVDVLVRSTRAPVVVLTADDEGRLAWEGAVARMDDPPGSVAVVDLGGGSCEIAVGTPTDGPSWVRSRDAGALRVTRALFPGERISKASVDDARRQIRRLLGKLDAPRPGGTLAVGGTARAVGRLVGRQFGARELEKLAKQIARKGPARVVEGTGITAERAQTLLGGTLVLAEIARQLDSRLEVGRGGLREGAALALARAEAAVA